jgi:radical SAM protein with 4Fe4S-binding SPASM domain
MGQEKIQKYLNELEKYHFLYKGNADPSKDLFISSLHEKFELAKKTIKEFYKQHLAYSNLYITNDLCNLTCKYCITRYKSKPSSAGLSMDPEIKRKTVYLVLDQYIQRNIDNRIRPISINFNGGEILVEWDFIKDIVQRISQLYPGLEFKYVMNTNMTLMTKEIATFMNANNFDVYISIDGYREAHNKTRKYVSGMGTFDDVIKGIKIYNKYNKKKAIVAFQGTIEYPKEFEPHKLFDMKKYGFMSCRLSPNLLNISEADAVEKSKLMEALLRLNLVERFKVGDIYFNNIEKLINMDQYSFFFNCIGLSCLPSMGININITKLKASCLCSFIDNASLPLEELSYDIYNPKLGEMAINFIYKRLKTLEKKCINCDVIGICRGGCILNGLDKENERNLPACVFQNEMWKSLLRVLYEYKLKKDKIAIRQ